MRYPLLICVLALALTGVGTGVLIARQERVPALPSAPKPPVEAQAVRALIAAQPFELEEPSIHTWRAEQPLYRSGWLLVLECDPQYLVRRQTPEHLLYAGAQILERLNHGMKHGRVVMILPTEAVENDAALLAREFYVGSRERPEVVDAARIARERESARAPLTLSAAELSAARNRGGELIRFENRTQLEEHAAQWILEHAPEDRDLAEGWLVPR